MEAIINDSLVGTALTLGCIFIALVCVQLSEVSMMILGLQHNIGLRVINLVLALVISLFIGFIITAVIESGVTTTFVCLAEDPAALRRNDPELYNEISSRYGNILL